MSELDLVEPGINEKGQPDNTSVTELLLRAEMHMKCRNPIPSWKREQRYFCLQSSLPKFLPEHEVTNTAFTESFKRKLLFA